MRPSGRRLVPAGAGSPGAVANRQLGRERGLGVGNTQGAGRRGGGSCTSKVTSVVPSDPQNALWFYLLLLKGIPVTTKI